MMPFLPVSRSTRDGVVAFIERHKDDCEGWLCCGMGCTQQILTWIWSLHMPEHRCLLATYCERSEPKTLQQDIPTVNIMLFCAENTATRQATIRWTVSPIPRAGKGCDSYLCFVAGVGAHKWSWYGCDLYTILSTYVCWLTFESPLIHLPHIQSTSNSPLILL